MQEYTAIWSDYFQSGSHNHSITRVCRFRTNRQDIMNVLEQDYNVSGSCVTYIFIGWPLRQGESPEDVKETTRSVSTEFHEAMLRGGK